MSGEIAFAVGTSMGDIQEVTEATRKKETGPTSERVTQKLCTIPSKFSQPFGDDNYIDIAYPMRQRQADRA